MGIVREAHDRKLAAVEDRLDGGATRGVRLRKGGRHDESRERSSRGLSDREHRREELSDFLHSRSRENPEPRAARRLEHPLEVRVRPVALELIEDRVAHVLHFEAATRVEAGLERQDDERPIGSPLQLPDSPRAPRPELGDDVVEHGDGERFCGAGDLEVQSGVIDQNDDVGPLALEPCARLAHEGEERASAAENLDQSHHGERREIHGLVLAGGAHSRTAVAEHANGWVELVDLADEVGAVKIAGDLAGRYEDARVAGRPGGAVPVHGAAF